MDGCTIVCNVCVMNVYSLHELALLRTAMASIQQHVNSKDHFKLEANLCINTRVDLLGSLGKRLPPSPLPQPLRGTPKLNEKKG